jgi:hypothetical protein
MHFNPMSSHEEDASQNTCALNIHKETNTMPSLATTPKATFEKTTPARKTQEKAPSPPKKSRIGELLIREGYLTDAQVEHVLAVQLTRHPIPPFGELCVELGLVSSAVLGKILSKHHVLIPLGEMLVHLGLVTPEQIQTALSLQKKNKKRLGSILVEQGYLATNILVNILYQQAQLVKYISRGQ